MGAATKKVTIMVQLLDPDLTGLRAARYRDPVGVAGRVH
jgi:hypothetical protein